MKSKILLSSFVLFLITVSYSFYFLNKSLYLDQSKILYIEPGSSLNTISNLLKEQNIYKKVNLFKVYVVLTGKSRNLKSGEYKFSEDTTLKEIVKKIEKGDVFYREFRLKEGQTWLSIKQDFLNEEHIISDLEKDDLINRFNIKYNNLEGFFHPDTYYYKRGDKASSILERAHRAHVKILNSTWNTRSINIGIKTDYEALILASIIEREGVEKNKISGVFNRRLLKNMKLQSDPTVIYAMGEKYKGNIQKSDLRIRNPYNTYVFKGLPPSPIGLVSESSIKASVNPEIGNSLYFVSKGDGTHKFSDNLEDHNKAVKKYQLKIK